MSKFSTKAKAVKPLGRKFAGAKFSHRRFAQGPLGTIMQYPGQKK